MVEQKHWDYDRMFMLYTPNCCQIRQAVELAWHPGKAFSNLGTHLQWTVHIPIFMSMFTSLTNIAVITHLFWYILEHIRDLSQWADPAGRGMAAWINPWWLCYLYVFLHFFEHDTGILETLDSHRNRTGAVLSLGSMERSVFPNNGHPTENDGTHL